jgi:signal transduction histidine kinase
MGIAQNNLPPVYEIKTDTAEYLTLNDSNWQMLEDRTGNLNIDQVSRSPIADKFHVNTVSTEGVYVYWLRYRIKNVMAKKVDVIIPEVIPDYGDVYTMKPGGGWDHKMNGRYVPWSQRDGLKRLRCIIYTIQPGEELSVYERNRWVNPNSPPSNFSVPIFLVNKTNLEKAADDEPSILPPFLFGIFLVAAFLNLYFFIVVRERVYLFFSLVTAFAGFKNFYYSTDTLFREHPVTGNYVWYTCYVLSLFFFVHLVRYVLETFKYVPRWDKWLIAISIYTAVFIVLVRLHIIWMNDYRDAAGHGMEFLFILITFILYLRSPNKSARLKAIAVLPTVFLIGITIIPVYVSVLYKITGVPVPAFIAWLYGEYPVLESLMFEWLIIFFAVSLFRRFSQLQKQIALEAVEKERMAKEKEIERSQLIEQQKITLEKTVEERTAELKQSLQELKSTQSQLIQSEKMASLGELTAGIAHEIENPLNFVNNFSEVNKELIEEVKSQKSKLKSEELDNLLNDIADNEEKINHHGKRADSIVKGMLQHSRASSGQKELTDINKLADEYLRLSYHGMRAKDKSFNAEFKTDFDESIGKINVVPQDIGRVLLNLFNNAFYAVSERQKAEGVGFKEVSVLYVPTVAIVTKKLNDKIEIHVRDNGNGIPQNIVEKIFQPFFTTKPTGSGTGLGLSLAYDIIKVHGGQIKVETKQGEGSEFVIQLPIV